MKSKLGIVAELAVKHGLNIDLALRFVILETMVNEHMLQLMQMYGDSAFEFLREFAMELSDIPVTEEQMEMYLNRFKEMAEKIQDLMEESKTTVMYPGSEED